MSERVISIGKPVYNNDRCEVAFELPPDLRPFFRTTSFWFECPDAGEVPESIAIIPAVANLIPFAWVFGCELEVASLDKAFYDSIPEIKLGYINMLPKLQIGGTLKVGTVVCNSGNPATGRPLLLFSGGVDAWCSFVHHVDERPHLVSIWGSDIPTDNDLGWDVVDRHSKTVAESFNLSYSHVRSNLREMIDYRVLDSSPEMTEAGYKWWHELQHGIGLLSLAAPLGYATGAPIVYIASSFTARDKGTYVCASDPTIDNHFAVGSLRAIHDGYELTRQDKVDSIVRYAQAGNKSLQLRVCYHVSSGRNCCRCEKCARTILEILAAGGRPEQFGLDCPPWKFNILMWRMKHVFRLTYPMFYYEVAAAVRERNIKLPKSAEWVLSDNLDEVCDNDFKRAWERFHNFGAGLYYKLIGR